MGFVYVSGRPSLDFAGTLKWRRGERPEEQLTEPGSIGAWALGAGLVDRPIAADEDAHTVAVALREAVYRTVRARLDRRRPGSGDVALLNERARRPRLTPRLRPDGRMERGGSVDELLATLAADLLGLLAHAEFAQVKECAAPDCTRLYVDRSRAGNRQWCGMSECGNRAKVEAFRRRRSVTGHSS
jgi:predicted RNA-binding Zn ribbon-like protein